MRVGKKTELSTEYSLCSTPDGVMDTFALGACWTFRQSRVKARADSSGKVFCLVEETVHPNMHASVSAELDHYEERYKIGIGMSVGLDTRSG